MVTGMADCFQRNSRIALAAPAVVLFVVTCLASLLSPPAPEEFGGDAKARDGLGPMRLRHGHHGHRGYRHENSGDEPDGGGGGGGGDSSPYDFYVYSMTFQPEFCREQSRGHFPGCRDFEERWEGQLTIHGLWPNRFDGSWPSNCSREKLDISSLSSIASDMSDKWPDVKGGHSFWEHEWDKHGTCSGLAQLDYFRAALGLLVDTPPVVRESIGSTVVRDDLLGSYGGEGMTALVCKGGGYLSEVRVCFARGEGGAVGDRIVCPGAILGEDSCGDEIKVAAFGEEEDEDGDSDGAVVETM